MAAPNLTPGQRELIEQTLQRIEREPERFNMDGWTCGTAMCFAGHLVTEGYPAASVDTLWDEIEGRHIGNVAEELLGLPYAGGGPLFYLSEWPEDLMDDYSVASAPERAAVLRRRIEHWMATGE